MGLRGPKAKTQNIRPLPDGMSEKRPGPRKGMTLRAQRTWKEIVASLPPTHFRPGDYPLLRAYCEAEALHFKACEKIEEEGAVLKKIVVITNKETEEKKEVIVGTKANPWVAIMVSQAGVKAQMATKLKICQSTKRKGEEQPEKPKSKRKGLMYGGDNK